MPEEKTKSENLIDKEAARVEEKDAGMLAGMGHNAPPESVTKDVGGVAGERLRSFIERVERLTEEKTAMIEDIKEIYLESKSVGFDAKTIRKIVKLRAMDTQKRREADDLLELYKSAIGMD